MIFHVLSPILGVQRLGHHDSSKPTASCTISDDPTVIPADVLATLHGQHNGQRSAGEQENVMFNICLTSV